MVDVCNVNFGESLTEKLQSLEVPSLTELEVTTVNSIQNGDNLLIQHGINNIFLEASAIKKAESIKKLKTNRSARVLVICDSSDDCDNMVTSMKKLVTKEIVIVATHEGKSLKKAKKSLEGPVDIVVGTIGRLNELLDGVLSTKNIKQFYSFCSFEQNKNLILDLYNKLNSEVNESTESTETDKKLQLILTCFDIDSENSKFLEKFNCEFQKIKSESSTISETSEKSESDSDKEEVDNSDDDEEKDSTNKEPEAKKYEIDDAVMKRLSEVSDFEKHEETAKILLQKYSDLEVVSRFIALSQKSKTPVLNGSNGKTIPKKPVYTGENVSKYTGREGFTAYHFRTNREVFSKGYLFRALKRLVDEDIVEQINHVMMEHDKMGFVFDLASEYDDKLQNSWSDGKFDQLELLEGEIPELIDPENNQAGGNRGGRGGYRGGRGNDRGGFRGGRGQKRPYDNNYSNGNAKVKKFN